MKQFIFLIFSTFLIINVSQAQSKKRKLEVDAQHVDLNRKIKVQKNIFNPDKKYTGEPFSANFTPINESQLHLAKFKVQGIDADNNIKWLEGRVTQNKDDSWELKSKAWIESVATVLNIDMALSSFVPQKIWTDDLGQSHVKLNQYHNAIKVYNAEIILHSKEGIIVSQNGDYVQSEKLPTEKSNVIDASVIRDNIKSQLKDFNPDWNLLTGLNHRIEKDQIEQELVYYDNDGSYILAYHMTVYPHMAEHIEYIIDASNGDILEERSIICKLHNHDKNHDHTQGQCNGHYDYKNSAFDGQATANARDLLGANRTIQTYDVSGDFFLIDASRTMFNAGGSNMPNNPEGVIWTIDMQNNSPANDADYFHVISNNNSWGSSPEGVSAHYNAGTAYDYYKEVHGRESISGDGQNIISFVNVSNEDGTSMGNAFWNGLGIFYGNGDNQFLPLGRGLDVAGHEMSHGVIQATANLEYRGESGALNESFADIFGAMIDREDWLIGEDVIRSGDALRNMQNPHNNAATGDFGGGWQPDHYDEIYRGSLDNGGVHINSGITNRAYYLFATATSKNIAERVYYRALTTYLTRSSQFSDLRAAVLQSANDLYASNPNVVTQAAASFDQVGIEGDEIIDYQEDVDVNPGDDLLLFADAELSNLFMINITQQEFVFNPLTTTDIYSKPSVTDDGEVVVFVGQDRRVHLIEIDWNTSTPTMQQSVLIEDAIWDNIVIAKDASRLAGTFMLVNPESDIQNRSVWVFDFEQQAQQVFELYNPTFSEGVLTGNVLYPDAIEFDITSNTVMYDAFNRVNSSNSGTIEFWDIGFLEVWNPTSNTFALGDIEKLFGSLPEGISVGNPTFAKNSPFIIALDYIEEGLNEILGVNIETGDVGVIYENAGLGYPSYSRNDRNMIYDVDIFSPTELGIITLDDTKINPVQDSDNFFFQNPISSKWGVWFSNGERILSGVEEIVEGNGLLEINPNPVSDILNISLTEDIFQGEVLLEIIDMNGRVINSQQVDSNRIDGYGYNVNTVDAGIYLLSLRSDSKVVTRKFIKQ
ncbi:M4 family metallopeptidase [Saprospiraceae bacterium]|nr:M4 family metallopeptidase [Saprospiraceae bacterium]